MAKTEKVAVNGAARLSDISEVLSYCPESGLLYWKVARGRCAAGAVAGYDTGRGYVGVRVNKRCTYAHRVAFLLMTGREPEGEIDHINGDRSDNRWANLRDVSQAENMMNRMVSSTSRSGVMGVFWNSSKKKWTAKIKKNRKTVYLGDFDDIADAKAARKVAERALGFHENHGRTCHG